MSLSIAGYRVERELGRGAMATVYLAIQESLERPVALKVLDPAHASTPEFTRRFLAEGRTIAAIRHPGIIAVHDLGIVDGSHYIITEYLEGGDLRARIAAGVSTDQGLDLVRRLATALGAAHRAGVVHRDVKPANILFRADGTPVLADFGIAKRLDIDHDLTLTGTVLGSPSYLSPEQATGRPVDGRSDLYSLGVILFELLTGRKPFRGQSAVDTMLLHVTEPVPELPEGLRRHQPLLERLLAKDPADRFPTAEALLDFLDTSPAPGAIGPSRPAADLRPGASQAAAPPPLPAGSESGPGPSDARAPGLAGRLRSARWPSRVARRRAVIGLALALSAVTAFGLARRPEPAALVPQATLEAPPPPLANGSAPYLAPGGVGETPAAPPTPPQSRADPPAQAPGSEPPSAAIAGPGDPAGATPPAPRPEPLSGTPAPAPPPAGPSATDHGEPGEDLERYLALAREAISQSRLTTPPERSAYAYLQQARRLAPNDPRIATGLREIGRRYAALARASLERSERAQANQYIDRGLTVRPGNRELLALRQEANPPPPPRPLPARLFDQVRRLF